MSPVNSTEVFTLPATCIASKGEQQKAINPKNVELVPHNAPSARLQWTRFLLQSLRRPLGYTECPHFNPESPVAEHNASNVTSQQRRGFHPFCHMHCKQMRAKKGNEPPKGSNLSLTRLRVPVSDGPDSSCSVCGAPWGTQNALTSTQTPQWQGTTLQMSPVSSAEVFTLPATCIASKGEQKKAIKPKNVELVPHNAPSARLQWTRFLLQSLRRPVGYTECPHFNPESPVAEHNASNVTSQQRRDFHPTCHMHCKQMRAKKGNEPHKRRTCPSQCSECPSPMDPIPLAVAAAPLGVHGMPSLRPRLPSGRAQRFKCHQSTAQRFSPYLPHALQANKSKKRQ